jgi:N-acetyl-anhydromuramyl-L-alanine amidase AmpD
MQGSSDPNRVLTQQFRPERLRVFVLTEGSGKPVSGVPVSVVAEFVSAKNNETRHIPVAMLQSDRVGYLSLKLGRIAQNPELRHIWLRPLNEQELEVDAFPVLNAGVEPVLVTINLPPKRAKVCQKKLHLPSIPDPDVTDWHISPDSLGNRPDVSLGEGPCEELLHSREMEGSFRFHQLVRDGGDPQILSAAELATCEVQNDEFSIDPRTRCYRLGAMLEYEITWEPIGHGLGRVVYSLPLAPCESVRIAVIDWRRQDEVSRDEDTSLVETLHHSQRRDRDIEEVVRATLTERQIGGSFMGGFGASGSKGGKSSSFGGSGSMGGAVTGSRGSRRLAAETAQHIADEISQSSTALRRLNSTIVVQASQAEQEVLQTRIVANHNHCHALTVLYYEVVRHYRVRVRLVHKQDVVFVRYGFINDMQEPFISNTEEPGYVPPHVERFSPRVVLRYRDVLKPILLDTLLVPCFEAVAKLYCAERTFLQTPPDIPAGDYDLEEIEIRFTTGSTSPGHVKCYICPSRGEEIQLLPPEDYEHPGAFEIRSGDITANGEFLITMHPEKRIRWGNIDSIKLHSGHSWSLTHVLARTQHGDHLWEMVNTDSIDHDFESENDLYLDAESFGPRTPAETLTSAERCCVDGLIEHLNLNKTFYSRAIWISQDAEERARAFERYAFQVEGEEGSRLTDFIENRIVGVTGDYVAFPMTVSQFADELVQEGEVISERIVTLPTRGLFAETKLSNCTACEERDVTRYWDWTESPCPEPPEIAPIEAGGRAQEVPEVTPTTFPTPVVNIVNPPSAPDPTGLAAALTLLGTPNIFRDMSAAEEVGALVRDLAKGSISLAEAQRRAQDIESSRQGRATEGSGTSTSAESTPTELHDRSTVVNRAIEQGESSGAVSEEQANEMRRRVLEQIISSFSAGGGSTDSENISVPPTGSDNGATTFQIRARNRYCHNDPEISYRVLITSAVYSWENTFSDGNFHAISTDIPPGTHVLTIASLHSPLQVHEEPSNWPDLAPTNPDAQRIWLGESTRIEVDRQTDSRGVERMRIVSIGDNPNFTLSANRITVNLRPLWAQTPNKVPRTAGDPEFIIIHHTAGRQDLPPHFIGITTPGVPLRRAASHYVITRGDRPELSPPGKIIKLGNEGESLQHTSGSKSAWTSVSGQQLSGQFNNISIGIEIVHYNNDYLEQQYTSLLELLSQLRGRYPAIVANNIIGHMDVALHTPYPNGELGDRILDPGRTFDWPQLEDAGFGIKPAAPEDAFADEAAEDIYSCFFKYDNTIKVSASAPPEVISEIKNDLTAIGYYIPTSTTAVYDSGTQQAIKVFKSRFFSGSRLKSDETFYNDGSADYETAQMIKRVLCNCFRA